ncbi:DNA polymerase IV [Alicyclobacillus acidiphilus]|uniref:DNA polymerase IV n=1 Tax=Alicyclobacillus acidiphilus TaxID=182455 RepID=UPI000831FB81|nr:DNA polymerase IV [Alicyclobacillus acidiphilus]
MEERRAILHVDMNAFYASCHAAAQPEAYRGKPIAVAGSPETRHGIVVTASYEARRRGVRTTMNVAQARRLCPDLILIEPDFELYRNYARKVFDVVRRFTPLVEIVSIDECYADVTGSRQFGSASEIAHTIQSTLRDELQLPCSIGVSYTKFFAKMGSNLHKPMGITEITEDNFQDLIWPLPIEEMHGVGEKSAIRLEQMGIRTIGSLAVADRRRLHTALGTRGLELRDFANGLDSRPVTAERPPVKSVGHSITLPSDTADPAVWARTLLNLSDQVGRRLRKEGKLGRVVTLAIRDHRMNTITRRHTLDAATNLTEDIYREAIKLLQSNWQPNRPIRLLGVTTSNLTDASDTPAGIVQRSLFDDNSEVTAFRRKAKLQKLTEVTDAIRNRYGENSVIRGRMLEHDSSNALRNHTSRGTSLQKDKLYEDD